MGLFWQCPLMTKFDSFFISHLFLGSCHLSPIKLFRHFSFFSLILSSFFNISILSPFLPFVISLPPFLHSFHPFSFSIPSSFCFIFPFSIPPFPPYFLLVLALFFSFSSFFSPVFFLHPSCFSFNLSFHLFLSIPQFPYHSFLSLVFFSFSSIFFHYSFFILSHLSCPGHHSGS